MNQPECSEFELYHRLFRLLAAARPPARQLGAVLIPAVGAGTRFAKAGYADPKPFIPVSGKPMILQAAADLPQAPRLLFVLRRDLPAADRLEAAVLASLPSATIIWLNHLTDGQATTCAEALRAADLSAPVTIGSCDNGLLYDGPAFEELIRREDVDLVVWGYRGHADAARRPEMFGWIESDEYHKIKRVSVKERLKEGDTRRDPIVVGAFSFARAGDFLPCFDRLVARDGRINGEFYVDSLVNDAVALGLNVRLFEVDGYLGWGTPDDLQRFEYWQSYFDQSAEHPYLRSQDRHILAPG